MAIGGGLEPPKGISRMKPNRVLTMGEKEREIVGYVLPWPHGGRQMYLPKSGAGTNHGGRG